MDIFETVQCANTVAPFAGAWIEIPEELAETMVTAVAPFAGAWIEITLSNLGKSAIYGRSLRGSVD